MKAGAISKNPENDRDRPFGQSSGAVSRKFGEVGYFSSHQDQLRAALGIGHDYISIAKLDTERFVCLLCLSSFDSSVKLDIPLNNKARA